VLLGSLVAAVSGLAWGMAYARQVRAQTAMQRLG